MHQLTVVAPRAGAGTGKTKTILGLLSVLANAVPADSPQLLRVAAPAGGGVAAHSRRALFARASPWMVRSGDNFRCFLVV